MIEILAVLAIGTVACLVVAHGLARAIDLALYSAAVVADELRLLLAGVVARTRSIFRR